MSPHSLSPHAPVPPWPAVNSADFGLLEGSLSLSSSCLHTQHSAPPLALSGQQRTRHWTDQSSVAPLGGLTHSDKMV